MKLATYSHGKLLEIDNFSGKFFNDVWSYLDNVNTRQTDTVTPYEELGYKKLPEPKSNIAKDCLAYVNKLMSNIPEDEKDKLELEFVATMREKYPRLNWQCGRLKNVQITR